MRENKAPASHLGGATALQSHCGADTSETEVTEGGADRGGMAL